MLCFSDGVIVTTIKESFRMKKCISFRTAGTCSMLLRGFALSCRVLRLNKVVVVSSSKFYVINFATDRNQVTETAVENHLEGSHSFLFPQ